MSLYRGLHLAGLGLTSDEAGQRGAQVSRTRVQCPQRRKVRLQALRLDLEHLNRGRQIPQPPRPQIQQIHSAEQNRGRLGQQDLPAMPGGHHPRRTVQHRTEIVALSQLGFPGRQPHPHRQLQPQLRGHRGIHRRARRGERGAHAVTGVLEQPAPVRLDRRTQHLVVCGQRCPHALRVGLPPTGRTLNIGEQKRHHPRRSNRRRRGHPRSLSQTDALIPCTSPE
jgi:hypothetical protein